ncbi:MAG: glycosyl transferase group 1 [Fibrobacteres bacterium]|nr:glycosyl transferase group 1 [Fibrobacterota bacterium]
MKILQIHNQYKFFGGTDRVALSEREILSQKGHDVTIFERSNMAVDDFGLREKMAFFPNVLHHRTHLRELEALIRANRPDVAHLHNIYPLISIGVYPLLRRLGIPSIQSFHDHRLAMLCPQANAFREGKRCTLCHNGNYLHAVRHSCVRGSLPISAIYSAAVAFNKYSGNLAKNLTVGIVFNDYMRDKLLAIGFPEHKLMMKPHFVQEDPGLPDYEQENYCVFMGAIAPHKGIFTLLEAFKKPLANGLRLKIIGDGESMRAVQAFIERESMANVDLLGFMGGVERLLILKRGRFSIVPSECFETFGVSIIESFACGVPVVGARIGAIPDLIKQEDNGLLFSPGDSAELRQALEILDDTPSKCVAMGKKARRKFEEEFTADRNYSRLMEIYESAIARQNGSPELSSGH